MTYLALDVGTRRIGVAVGSTDLRLATPLGVIRRGTAEADAARVREMAEQYGAEKLVFGFPRELDGSVGAQASLVSEYATILGSALNMPYEFFDERYSTAEALAKQHDAGKSDREGRATIDALAAAVILQDFFNSGS